MLNNIVNELAFWETPEADGYVLIIRTVALPFETFVQEPGATIKQSLTPIYLFIHSVAQ